MHSKILIILVSVLLIVATSLITAQLPFLFLEVCSHENEDKFIQILNGPCSQESYISVAPLTRVNVTGLPVKGSCGESYYVVDVFGVRGYLETKYACNAYSRVYRSGDVVKPCNSGGALLFSSASMQNEQGTLASGQIAMVMSDPIYVSGKKDYSYRVLIDQKSFYAYRGQICSLSFAN